MNKHFVKKLQVRFPSAVVVGAITENKRTLSLNYEIR